MIKVIAIFAVLVFGLAVVSSPSVSTGSPAGQGKKPPETIVLAKQAKLGGVAFNHLKHITEKRSPDDIIVRRKGKLFVINKRNPKHKQRQG